MPQGIYRNMTRYIFGVNTAGLGWQLTLCTFTILLILSGVIFLEKEGATDLSLRHQHLNWGLKEISCRAFLLFWGFFGNKKKNRAQKLS